ncbi:unnamed protein product [Microthlaspi erraticum]|uniref:RNase H type-1 domain-containing protein n=1 Tax=Microthlaspi erraticum TaxID=1685480 RepID=A0A6D2JAP5_9BRAS|nr:unnamed protein product [Microthlaspi erraticum]
MVFETDCSDVVKMVSKREEWPAFAILLDEVDRCKMGFTSFSIVHIPMTNNTKADKMICNACESDEIEGEEEGYFYCQKCGVRGEGIIGTAVNDDDLIGGTRGALYQQANARRLPPQLIDAPQQPIHT